MQKYQAHFSTKIAQTINMKLLKVFSIFVLVLFFLQQNPNKIPTALAKNTATNFEFILNNNSIKFNSFDLCSEQQILSKWNRNAGGEKIKEVCNKILNMGFSYEVCANFMFPGIDKVFDTFEKKINTEPISASLNLNSDTPQIKEEKFGEKFLREETAKELINNLNNNKTVVHIKTQKILPKFCKNDIKNCKTKKSKFSTWCGNSSESRKNNIRLALKSINEKAILPGETFSFNEATGGRGEANGYQKAKIISNGKYVEGTGGGVCQVSTTLYNAALLAGLDIVEVHPHSLTSSYIAPSRDAMVSGSFADLKIKNNFDKPVFISARLVNSQDIVIKIYGQQNQFSYEINSQIIKTTEHGIDQVSTDLSLSPQKLSAGETHRVAWPKDGLVSEAYLIKKDNAGHVVEKQKIRHDEYQPMNGMVISA